MSDAPQIPTLFGQRELREISLLDSFPDLDREAAIVLVKSARLYQQALWVCDTTPETAWLLLVSAIETAAGYWNAAQMTPAERLNRSYPQLVRVLRENAGDSLVDKVAAELHKLIAATGKFIGFCTTFAPDPPENRPQFGRFDFAAAAYKDAIEKIYRYRSRALHGGTPFPSPMCWPPRTHHDVRVALEERPLGLGAGALGSTWVADDLPMLLHVFAHITRGALLKWWRSLAPSQPERVL